MSEPVEISSSSDEENGHLAKKRKTSEDSTEAPNYKADNSENAPNGEDTVINQEVENLAEINRLYEDSKEIRELLQKCYEKIHVEKTKHTFIAKVRLLKRHYDAVGLDYVQSEDFKVEMQRRIGTCDGPRLAAALQMFIELFKELETASKRMGETGGNRHAIRRLERFLKRLHIKIAELEEREVDFDEEENSSYLKLERYRERAVKVYEKLCKYRNENVHAGDITKRKVDFSGSEYMEINRSISKEYKGGLKFPTYCDIEQCIRKCVKKNDMDMSEAKIQIEARSCFEKLGNLLQNRRKLDLLDMHSSYLKSRHDPAADDPQLNETLNKHKSEANKAISNIVQKYVIMQEDGKEVQLSDDSDDSNYGTSEDENQK